jgi:hypothetical protein
MSEKSTTISKNTLAILKNFSSINSNILVKPGSLLQTKNISGSGLAQAIVPETFNVEFGIWDLNQFLGMVSCCTNPSFEFHEKHVNIKSENGSEFTFFYSEPRLLTVPKVQPKEMKATATASIDEDRWTQIVRAASVLQVDDISFVSTEDGVTATVTDLNDPTSHKYTVHVGGENNGHKFEVNFKISNIKILSGDYQLSFVEANMVVFQHTSMNLTYWFGAESTSTYDE